MLKFTKKDTWNILCVFWSMAVALFWFAMRVIWSGISKVLYEALGKKEPTEFLLNFPLYVSIFLWILCGFAVVELVRRGNKKRSTITLTVLLGVFTVASAVVVIMGAIDYLYFILPKFFLSMLIGLCIAGFAALLFAPPAKNGKVCVALKCGLLALVMMRPSAPMRANSSVDQMRSPCSSSACGVVSTRVVVVMPKRLQRARISSESVKGM